MYFDHTLGVCASKKCGDPATIGFYARGPMHMKGVIDYWWFSVLVEASNTVELLPKKITPLESTGTGLLFF